MITGDDIREAMKQLDDVPPLSDEQIRAVAVLLSSSTQPAAPNTRYAGIWML